jgi:hypothetical protein
VLRKKALIVMHRRSSVIFVWPAVAARGRVPAEARGQKGRFWKQGLEVAAASHRKHNVCDGQNELNTNIDICLSNIPFLDGGEKKAGRIRSIDRSVWHQSLEIRHTIH